MSTPSDVYPVATGLRAGLWWAGGDAGPYRTTPREELPIRHRIKEMEHLGISGGINRTCMYAGNHYTHEGKPKTIPF